MPTVLDEIKSLINTRIRLKDQVNSITPDDVADSLDAIADALYLNSSLVAIVKSGPSYTVPNGTRHVLLELPAIVVGDFVITLPAAPINNDLCSIQIVNGGANLDESTKVITGKLRVNANTSVDSLQRKNIIYQTTDYLISRTNLAANPGFINTAQYIFKKADGSAFGTSYDAITPFKVETTVFLDFNGVASNDLVNTVATTTGSWTDLVAAFRTTLNAIAATYGVPPVIITDLGNGIINMDYPSNTPKRIWFVTFTALDGATQTNNINMPAINWLYKSVDYTWYKV